MASFEPSINACTMVGMSAWQELDVFIRMEVFITYGADLGAPCSQWVVLDDRQVFNDNGRCGVFAGFWKDACLISCSFSMHCCHIAKGIRCSNALLLLSLLLLSLLLLDLLLVLLILSHTVEYIQYYYH